MGGYIELPKLTKKEWIRQHKGILSKDDLVIPCTCNKPGCRGWTVAVLTHNNKDETKA